MDNQALQQRVEQISLRAFHRPFTHQAVFNRRLKTTGGRFHLRDGHLDFNPTMFANHPEAIDGIIKHELTHYHLYALHRGYKHGDRDFKQLLAQVGGSRYAPAPDQSAKWHYQCAQCGMDYYRSRKINLQRYRCGRCHGRLVLQAAVSS